MKTMNHIWNSLNEFCWGKYVGRILYWIQKNWKRRIVKEEYPIRLIYLSDATNVDWTTSTEGTLAALQISSFNELLTTNAEILEGQPNYISSECCDQVWRTPLIHKCPTLVLQFVPLILSITEKNAVSNYQETSWSNGDDMQHYNINISGGQILIDPKHESSQPSGWYDYTRAKPWCCIVC